ncbi:MAG TPA: hypothetical protein VIQ04_03660, partial [Nitrososphaeraceae archaeon]
MLKDVFVLRRNSWHSKIMSFIWKLEPTDFSHMCPYFWITILNLLIIIPFSVYKAIEFAASKVISLVSYIIKLCENKKRDSRESRLQSFRNDPDILSKLVNANFSFKRNSLLYDFYMYVLPNIDISMYKEVSRLRSIREKAKEQKITAKQKIVQLNKIARVVAPFCLYVLAALATLITVYGLYLGVHLLFTLSNNTWMTIGQAALIIAIILLVMIIVIVIL